mgnify:CR=1 FL=1
MSAPTDTTARTVGVEGLQEILDALRVDGTPVYGPVERDGAIVVRPLESVDELPVGVGTDHGPGRAHLTHDHDHDHRRFGWAVGPQAWKPLLHPATVSTIEMTQEERAAPVTVRRADPAVPLPPGAVLFGVRPCDLAAIGTLDRVLLHAPASPEPVYLSRRDVTVVVVDCTTPAATCFCASMGTGPHAPDADGPYDLRITELDPADGSVDPDYVVRAGSATGREVLRRLDTGSAVSEHDHERVAEAQERAVAAMSRQVDPVAIREVTQLEPDAWSDVAERCVACGNCTAVCPTCFCTSIDDVGDLSGRVVTRERRWASCFELEYSRLGSAPVRSSHASRYRQWFTHKFATWHDQFGSSGCVGCGRCIAWCPIGIDVTAEAARLLQRDPEAADGSAP